MNNNKDLIKLAKELLEGTKINEAVQTYASLEEASGGSDPDITVWTKTGKHNYDSFLASNEDRVGKPMIDGGLKANYKDADKVNGQPVDGMIYCGAGCVTFKNDGKKVFMKMPSGYINTNDGTLPWSKYRSYDSEHVYISTSEAQFNAIAKALAIAAKV